jgi:molybdopterin converting factor small subunit
MHITVTFYGGLKQDVGAKQQTLELERSAVTAREVADALAAQYPALAARLATVAFVVDDTIVPPDHVLHDGDTAALLPPVSGG